MEEHLEEAKVEVADEVKEVQDNKVEESTNAKEEVEESTDIDKEEQEEVDEDEEGKAGQGDLFFSGTWSSHKCTGLRFAPDHVLIDHRIITVHFLSKFDPHIATVSYDLIGPGISAHPEQCSKFWLCRQLGEGAGLQVSVQHIQHLQHVQHL